MEYWTKKSNISHQQLSGAVRATGSRGVKKVEEYLKKMERYEWDNSLFSLNRNSRQMKM